MRALFPLFLCLGVVACDGDTDTDTDVDTTDDVDTGTETDEPTSFLGGRVRDEDGQGLGGVRVNMCRQVCYTAETDETGAYAFESLASQLRYSLHVETVGDLVAVDGSVPFTLPGMDNAPVQLDLVVPSGTPIALPSERTEIEPAADLLLTVGAGDLTILFEEDPVQISAARVAIEDWMPIDLEGTVEAVWYLDPWSAEADPAVDLRIRDTFGASGDTYTLYQANYDDAEWDTLGTLTSDGTHLTGDFALDRLDTLVLISAASR